MLLRSGAVETASTLIPVPLDLAMMGLGVGFWVLAALLAIIWVQDRKEERTPDDLRSPVQVRDLAVPLGLALVGLIVFGLGYLIFTGSL